jgi:hypothetical protein
MTEVTRSNHPGKPALAVADDEPLVGQRHQGLLERLSRVS